MRDFLRKFLQLLIILLCILLILNQLFIVSFFVTIPWLSDFTNQFLKQYPVLLDINGGAMLLTVVSVAVAAFVLVAYLSRPDVYIIKKARGNLEISRRSIASIATHAAEQFDSVLACELHVKRRPKPKKLRVYGNITVAEGQSLADVGEVVQEAIVEALCAAIYAEPLSIRLQVDFSHLDSGKDRLL